MNILDTQRRYMMFEEIYAPRSARSGNMEWSSVPGPEHCIGIFNGSTILGTEIWSRTIMS